MNDDKKYKTFTYTVNPSQYSWNLVLTLPTKVDHDAETEKKLSIMHEYAEAKSVLSKFTLNGKN